MIIVDTAANVANHLTALKAVGVTEVVRYLTSNESANSKLIRAAEARTIAAMGMRLILVFEDYGGTLNFSDINATHGVQHAKTAMRQAAAVGAPLGTILYFAIDTDVYEPNLSRYVTPYVRALKETLGDKYRLGIYACGFALASLRKAGLVDATWLTQSTGWHGYQDFKRSGLATMEQGPSTHLGGVGVDTDTVHAGTADYGAFVPWAGSVPVTLPPATPAHPVLRNGVGGADVVTLQRILNNKGIQLDVDGDFGPQTEAAVKRFQRNNGLVSDGIVGPLTWAKLQ